MPWFSGKRSSVWSSSQLLYKFCGRAATSRKHKSRAGTDRLRGLQWSWGEGVPTAAALGTEVRRRRRRVVYVRQDIVVSPLLLCAVGIVTVCWGGPSEMTIWNRREREKRLIWFRFFHLPSYFSFYSLTNPGFLKPITKFIFKKFHKIWWYSIYKQSKRCLIWHCCMLTPTFSTWWIV